MTYADLPPTLNVRQAAAFLGCSERHVRTLIANGELEHFRLGHLVRIARHQILQVVGANDSDPTVSDEAASTTNSNRQEGVGLASS